MLQSLEDRERVSRECYEMARGMKQDSAAQVQNALRLLNESLDAKPTHLGALLLRATLLTKAGELHAAVADLTLATQLEELSVDRRRLAGIYASRAAVYFRLRKPQEGVMDLTHAAELETDNGTWQSELGQAHLREGNVALAKFCLQSALQERMVGRMTDTARFRALLCLGACRLHDKELRLAAATLERAQGLHESAVLHHLMGLTRYREAAYAAAAAHFHRALELNERSLVYRMNLGVCVFALKDDAAAEQVLSAALAQHPKVPRLLFTHACLLLRLGMLAQALMELDEAIQLDPQPACFYYAKGLVHMAEASTASYAAAAVAFEATLQAQPDFHDAHLQLGLLAHHRGDLFGALTHLYIALDARRATGEGEEVAVLERLALVYGDLGQHRTAVRVLRRCVALCPRREELRYRLAVAQLCSQDYDGAWRSLQPPQPSETADDDDAAGSILSSAAAMHARAVALRELHRYDDALRCADAAVRAGATPAFYLNRAEVHFCMGHYLACVADTERVLTTRTEPHTSDVGGTAEAYYLQGRAYYALGRGEDALASLDRAADALPALARHSSFCYTRGVVLARAARWTDALRCLDTALTACGAGLDRCVYYHERAKVRQVCGDAAGAVADFDVVLARQPGNFNALLRRAFALKALHRFDEASRDLQRATLRDTSGALAHLTSQDFYALPFIELVPAGEESEEDDDAVGTASSGSASAQVTARVG